MKSYNILITILIAAFMLAGCSTKENYDYKVTIVPDSKSSGITPDDMNSAGQVISKRLINIFEIPNENMSLNVTESQISLSISNADTGIITSIKKTISGYNRLEFHETYENSEILGCLSKANDIIKDSLKTEVASAQEEFNSQNPLLGILKPMVTKSGEPFQSCMIGLVSGKDTSKVNRYLKREEVQAVFPADVKFYWSAKQYKYDPSKSSYGLHAIRIKTGNGQAPLDGTAIVSATPVKRSSDSNVKIDLTMSAEGTTKWAEITRENINRCIAVVYNGYVISYPRVVGEISGRNTEISGDFTPEEANDLANMLNSGQLPFELKIVKEQIIRIE
jgi:preprotein translocase subunit SecD